MMRKLLKYDLRANIKLFLFIWPAMLLFAGLQRLLLNFHYEGALASALITLLTTLMVLSMLAAFTLCFVICIIRFYSGLLRREGYLMFTLPVKPWQLLLSKFLTALFTLAVTAVLSYGGIALMFSGTTGGQQLLHGIKEFFGALSFGPALLFVFLMLAALANMILRVYFVSCLGHLFRRMRIFFSILFYYIITILIQVAAMVAIMGIAILPADSWLCSLAQWFGTLGANSALSLVFGGLLLLNIVAGCVYFFVSEVILRKRLNLD